MIYEMRKFIACRGSMPKLLARFSDHTLGIWARHGIRQVGFWTNADRQLQPGADLHARLGVAGRAQRPSGRRS